MGGQVGLNPAFKSGNPHADGFKLLRNVAVMLAVPIILSIGLMLAGVLGLHPTFTSMLKRNLITLAIGTGVQLLILGGIGFYAYKKFNS